MMVVEAWYSLRLTPPCATATPQVGSNGVLSIESSNSTETFVDVQEGMEIDRGYISPQFVTNQERLMVRRWGVFFESQI